MSKNIFKLNPDPTFEAPVVIAVPGKPAAKLRLIFRHKTRDEAKAFFERAANSDEKESTQLLEIVAGWVDVDAEFSEVALGQLLQNYHSAAQAIFEAYTGALTQARRGN